MMKSKGYELVGDDQFHLTLNANRVNHMDIVNPFNTDVSIYFGESPSDLDSFPLPHQGYHTSMVSGEVKVWAKCSTNTTIIIITN